MTHIKAKFHKTDLVIFCHSREENPVLLSYSQINMVTSHSLTTSLILLILIKICLLKIR